MRRQLIMATCQALALAVVCASVQAQRAGSGRTESRSLRLGGGVTGGNCHLPGGVVSQLSGALWRSASLGTHLVGAVRWSTTGACPHTLQDAPSDDSRLQLLASASFRMSAELTDRIAGFLQWGVAKGDWRYLPPGEADRPDVIVPLYEAGFAIRAWRRATFEVSAMNLRNVLRANDFAGATLVLSVPLRL